MENLNQSRTSKMVKTALLSAIAYILMYLDFSIIPAYEWLKIDFSDMPAMMAAFGLGPAAGIAVEFVKNFIYFFTKSSSGIAGVTANFILGCLLILPAGIMYKYKKSKKTAVLGMVIGSVLLIIGGIFTNKYILLPMFGMNMSAEAFKAYVIGGIAPLNLAKAVITSVITYILYKRVSVTVFKAEPNFGSPVKNKKIGTAN